VTGQRSGGRSIWLSRRKIPIGERLLTLYRHQRVSAIFPVYQINYHLDNGILLIRPALGDEQGQRHQGVVGEPLAPVGVVQDAVHAEEFPFFVCVANMQANSVAVLVEEFRHLFLSQPDGFMIKAYFASEVVQSELW
jgi:hypothetical protein